MGKKNKPSMSAIAIPILIILIPFMYSLFSFTFVQADKDSEIFLTMPDAEIKNCIRDLEYMRHHHWELLRAVREEVVRHGKRGEVSLRNCRNCHTSREQFCNKCHDAVSMKPDCYGCHYYP